MSERLDILLAARGLARSRTHAASLIAAGSVTVDGRGVVKAGAKVDEDSVIEVAGIDHYVSRAAHKLIAGLGAFAIDVSGRTALDMGASTGGFTQVLRERGASPVVAVDVGHGQLAPPVSLDAEVIAVEGYNVRHMTAENLAAVSGVADRPQIVTGDLSFISLTHVLPAVRGVCADDADVVLLVKPQFEVGRQGVREGLVTDPALRVDAVSDVLWSAWDAGFGVLGVIASPIIGTHGNREAVVHLAPGRGSDPSEWWNTVNETMGTR